MYTFCLLLLFLKQLLHLFIGVINTRLSLLQLQDDFGFLVQVKRDARGTYTRNRSLARSLEDTCLVI
jgi:hypothetical protein